MRQYRILAVEVLLQEYLVYAVSTYGTDLVLV